MISNQYKLKKFHRPSPHTLSVMRWNYKNVGLLGGTFNPPHAGHMHIALTALRRYKFDAIWWMVSPQNPLKQKKDNFLKRLTLTRQFVKHPKMHVCRIEQDLDVKYTLQTIEHLNKRFKKTHFHWIAGMDNAALFHRWNGWKKLLKYIPFTFFNRPPHKLSLRNNALRLYKGQKNIHFQITGKARNISSTELRNKMFATRLKSAI